MATQDGLAVTYAAPPAADFRELLLALYTFFNAGSDANWQIKAGVTLPAAIASTGDTGFVLEDTATTSINIIIADHAGVGGLMRDGAAIAAGDDLLVSVDPGGGVTDITPGGWTVGARWSGWAADTQGGTYSSMSGRTIVSSGVDWLFMRHKYATGYTGGAFAGKYQRLDAGLGDGFCIFGGVWADFVYGATNDHAAIESADGDWDDARLAPANASGLQGDLASDGAGVFRVAPVALLLPNGVLGSAFYNYTVVGVLPAIYSGPNGTASTQWKAGETVIAVNMDGGSWMARSDGAVAE